MRFIRVQPEDEDEVIYCDVCQRREPHIVVGSGKSGACLRCGTEKLFVRSRGVCGRVVKAVPYEVATQGGSEKNV